MSVNTNVCTTKNCKDCGCDRVIGNEGSLMTRLVVASLIVVATAYFKSYLSGSIELSLFLAAYLLSGYEVLKASLKNIAHGKIFDENFLMAIATIGAFSIGDYTEGVAVMIFFGIGEYFQDLAVNKSTNSINALLNLRPDFIHLKRGNEIIDTPPSDAKIGDIYSVLSGERIALDGIVKSGRAFIDTSAITGESQPIEASIDKSVMSGCINTDGVIEIEVTAILEESTASKILKLVQDAKENKPKAENFISKFASIYTPIVVLVALLISTIPPFFFDGNYTIWLHRALTFLVASCPCALVVSIPLSFYAGMGAASSNGILIKGGNYLEVLNKLNGIVFDKTGTLTNGVLKIESITPEEDFTEDLLLEYAAYAEHFSSHPIAKTVTNEYQKDIYNEKITDFSEISGMGVSISLENKTILAGNKELMCTVNIVPPKTEKTALHLSVNGLYAGYIMFSDGIKSDTKETIVQLEKLNIASYMFTGDNKGAADEIANKAGIKNYFANMLPQDKLTKFKELGGINAFVGDGINDAPVLANAPVGIAMGGLGRDAAVDAADVVIMSDQPSKVVTAILIARKTSKIVRQNVVFALVTKLAVFALVLLTVYTPMWVAVFADVGVALLTVLNATRLIFNEKR